MPRPKIKISREPADRIIEAIGLAAIVGMIALMFVYYDMLPDEIPSHFNITGKPDAFSSKTTIRILPAVGLVLYAGLAILSKYPHLFNYPVKVTEENGRKIYQYAARTLRIINTVIACMFCYLVYMIIQTSLGNQNGLGKYYLPFILAGVLGPAIYFIYQSIKAK